MKKFLKFSETRVTKIKFKKLKENFFIILIMFSPFIFDLKIKNTWKKLNQSPDMTYG